MERGEPWEEVVRQYAGHAGLQTLPAAVTKEAGREGA